MYSYDFYEYAPNVTRASTFFSIATGTNVTFEILVDGIIYNTTFDEVTLTGGTVDSVVVTNVGYRSIALRAFNHLSDIVNVCNFTIEEKILGEKLQVAFVNDFLHDDIKEWYIASFLVKIPITVIQHGAPMRAIASASNGTTVTAFFDFGDGHNWTYTFGQFKRWSGQLIETNHTYSRAGSYFVTVNFSNSVSNVTVQKPVWIMAALGKYALNASAQLVDRYAVTLFRMVLFDGDPAALANITFDWGDGQANTTSAFTEGETYQHLFASIGNFTVTAVLVNPVSEVTASVSVQVVDRVEGMTCNFQPANVWPGQQQRINISFVRGSDVEVALDNGATPIRRFPMKPSRSRMPP